MSVDDRCRRYVDAVNLSADETFDRFLPEAISRHGQLAARGVAVKHLPPLGLRVDGRSVTVTGDGTNLELRSGTEGADVIAEMAADALSDVVQDRQSTMGLAMTSRVQITRGSLDDWIRWEPALRALIDGRPVHEPGDVVLVGSSGQPLDLGRQFRLDDDPAEMADFLTQAGFLHLTEVFEPSEMAEIEADIDQSIASAHYADPEYWWCTLDTGEEVAVRSLNFHERSAAAAAAIVDPRLAWLADLTGDGHQLPTSCEGLVKPLGVVNGLSDLPWHKDCGQGLHSFMCNSLTIGISVTGADRVTGALGVIPGSHRANTIAAFRDPELDLPSRLLETATGDVTVHCSDTLHRAYPPTANPRKVVYTSMRLAPLPHDELKPNPRYSREARGELSSVQQRIAAADQPAG